MRIKRPYDFLGQTEKDLEKHGSGSKTWPTTTVERVNIQAVQ